jgi:hypothetical protein
MIMLLVLLVDEGKLVLRRTRRMGSLGCGEGKEKWLCMCWT